MVFTTWADVLNQSFQNLFYGLVTFLPNLVVAIIIFIIGWIIGSGLGRVVEQVINSLRIDQALKQAGVDRVLSRAGFELSSGRFVGRLVEWFFIIVFLVAALDLLHLQTVNMFLTTVVLGYLPQVIVAVLILLVAAVLAQAAENVVMGSAKAAQLHAAGFLGKVARYAIWIFAILAALDQLGIAPQILQILWTGIVIAVALAVGLAFGLGGQQSAARYLDHLQREIGE
jgi:small-conductance mechanosensitive channel